MLLLAFLYWKKPDAASLVQAQTKVLIDKLQASFQTALANTVRKPGSSEKTDDQALALRALGNKPVPFRFVPEVPATLRDNASWLASTKARLASSVLLELAGTDPAQKATTITLSLKEVEGSQTLRLVIDTRSIPIGLQIDEESWPSTVLPAFSGLIPPFLIIFLAVMFGRTIPALFAGVLLGAVMHTGGLPSGLWHFGADYVYGKVILELGNVKILGFVLMLAASIGIMTRSGGIDGMVELVKRIAKTARSCQLATWLMGLVIFFDDYANAIVVGSTMRPLTDRLRVSREKLAYIVDSTAAPVAGLAVLSTWVVTEISYFEPTLQLVKDSAGNPVYAAKAGFGIFLETMPFRFYCFLTLFMVLATVLLKREFGPMLKAERRARHEGKPLRDGANPMVDEKFADNRPKEGAPKRAINGLLPLVVLILVTIVEIWRTGLSELEVVKPGLAGIREILSNADSSWSIFLGASMAAVVAAMLAIGQSILTPVETLRTGLRSIRALSFAVAILVLAWCIGFVCDDLGTRYYIVGMASSAIYWLLPTILFLIACLVAFATGSSWSTMAILLPNVVLLAHELGAGTPLGGHGLMLLSIGAVLEGAIFGDHCSPISDTTVLSSMATASDHLDHVKTQAPYALLVMFITMSLCYLPVAYLRWPWEICMGLSAVVILAFLLLVGRNPEDPPGLSQDLT